MSRAIFKEYSQGQGCLFPMRLEDKIADNAPVRLVNQIVDQLDISQVINTYKGGGTSAYAPRMMLKLVIYAYLNNSFFTFERYYQSNIYTSSYVTCRYGTDRSRHRTG